MEANYKIAWIIINHHLICFVIENHNHRSEPTTPTEATTNYDAYNGDTNIAAQSFTFRDLAVATHNFRPDTLIGEGGFGRVYKGKLENSDQVKVK